MIKIEKIQIHEFRGIRKITLVPDQENFAACGPNGTGKSGIVDAVEFGLTGNISRLEGRGTGGLSVKQHGPHVNSQNKPEEAYVILDVYIPSLKKKATIQRTIKSADTPLITPADSDVKDVFARIAIHPEFVLSRRELISYILAEPGKRSKEVQALLRLDDLEKLRASLQKISNSCDREIPGLEQGQRDASTKLISALGIMQLSAKSITAAANPMREILGLGHISALEANTSIKDGALTVSGAAAPSRVPKIQALNDLKSLDLAIRKLSEETIVLGCIGSKKDISELVKDADLLSSVSRETLLRTALEQFDGERCPVCDEEWKEEEFMQHVQEKLKKFETAKIKRVALEKKLKPLILALAAVNSAIGTVKVYGPLLKKPIDVKTLIDVEDSVSKAVQNTRNLLPLKDTDASLDLILNFPDVSAKIAELETEINKIPEPSKQDAAREFLTVGQERLETYRETSLKLKRSRAKAKIAADALELYETVSTNALDEIYKQVEAKFVEYYRRLNKEDEAGFTAKLEPSIGKLLLDVDFYGKGHFPPGAYHSEGHQDSMGLCLYLALMSHLLGSGFTLAVLDDVVMSVDSGHRRKICELLAEEFTGTQFILTTHDEVWLRHMRSSGIIKPKRDVRFRTWDVDIGPIKWDDNDIWKDIAEKLHANDVKGASGLLRHYLEYFGTEACDRLRARIEFRGDAQVSFGEVFPGAVEGMLSALKKGNEAANSYGKTAEITALDVRKKDIQQAYETTKPEQWQINTAIHYNPWENLQKEDFEPVVAAFKNLTVLFSCKICGEMFSISPRYGTKEALRCRCGDTNVSLLPKQ